jgi:hypothetical protein
VGIFGRVITPEDKDWTWVLSRPCTECGFDAGACNKGRIPGLLRENAAAWQEVLDLGRIRSGRPDPSSWSTLEYACHLRDALRCLEGRIDLMVAEEDPVFVLWDQDAAAEEERYDEQDPAVVVDELTAAADSLAIRLEGISTHEWPRQGRRSDGVTFTVAMISWYALHEANHHLSDVSTPHR